EARFDLNEEADVAAKVREDLLDVLVSLLRLVDDDLAAVELVARGIAPDFVGAGRVLDQGFELLGLDDEALLFLRVVVERELTAAAATRATAALRRLDRDARPGEVGDRSENVLDVVDIQVVLALRLFLGRDHERFVLERLR